MRDDPSGGAAADDPARGVFNMGDVTEVTNRLQSMYDLRTRLEDLAVMHKNEEDGLRETMAALIMQCNEQQVRIEGLEELVAQRDAKLNEAERDKLAAVKMVGTFRREGEVIMGGLRRALTEAQQNYEREKDARTRIQHEFDAKLNSYRSLLEEQERVKDKLKLKAHQLEVKLRNAEAMIKDLSAQDGFHQQYLDVAAELKGMDGRGGGGGGGTPRSGLPGTPATAAGGAAGAAGDASLEHKNRLQEQIIKMLFAKLKMEQNHRLETEEQAALMVAAEEVCIRKLEEKLREAETERDASRASASGTPRMSGLGTPRGATPRRVGAAGTPLRPRRAPSLESPSPPKNGVSSGGAVVPAAAGGAASASDATTAGLPVHSLESQLAEVTKDFNKSLEMWSKKLAGTGPGASAAALPSQGSTSMESISGLLVGPGGGDVPTGDADTTGILQDGGAASPGYGDDADYLPDTPQPQQPQQGGAVVGADAIVAPVGGLAGGHDVYVDPTVGEDSEFLPESPVQGGVGSLAMDPLL